MQAQLSFFNDISQSLFRTVQQYSNLNIQLAQTMLEEGTLAGQQMLSAHRPTELIAAAAAHAQPAAEKLRAYQQHLSRIAADTHMELSKVAEEHVAVTSRTARELADEVARVTSEETEKSMRNQQEAIRKFADPFERHADSAAHQQSRGSEMRSSSTLQSAGHDGVDSRESQQAGNLQGNQPGAQQGPSAAPGSQAGKQQNPSRKET